MEHTIGAFRFVRENDELNVYKDGGLYHQFFDEDVPTTDFKEWCAFYVSDIAQKQQAYLDNKFDEKPSKPTLEEEVAKAVFQAFASFGHDGTLSRHVQNPNQWVGVCKPLNGMSPVVLAKALYLGYEEV